LGMASLALVSVMHMRLYHMLSVLHTPHLCVDEPHPPGRTEIVRVRLIGQRSLVKATAPFVWLYGMEPIIPLSNVEDTYTNITTVSFIPAPDGCRPTGWCRLPASRTTTIPVLVLRYWWLCWGVSNWYLVTLLRTFSTAPHRQTP
jgi:hypothetical protein